MLARLLLLFITVPLVELYLLFRLADITGPLATIAIVIGTGILGSVLARREGIAAWRRVREQMASGRAPTNEIQNGLMILVAAALLLTPGILTDAIGFTLLTAPGRRLIRRYVVAPMMAGVSVRVLGTMQGDNDRSRRPTARHDTIDATHVRVKS